jgi:hypothetical protein
MNIFSEETCIVLYVSFVLLLNSIIVPKIIVAKIHRKICKKPTNFLADFPFLRILAIGTKI